MSGPDRAELRGFGFGVGGPLAAIGTIALLAVWPFGESHPNFGGSLMIAGGGLGLLAALAPSALWPVHRVWMPLARAVSWFNTRVVLMVIYYLVLLPTGLLRRLAGDPLALRERRESYWEKRTAKPDVESYRRQV